uniref:Uncharacterized protein n=1 Tax=Timema bartmani TaxID=61472 RepID=A0A7R9HXV9_9NEOP|nr:unnamed protein product [Timema bartmani]
MDVTDSAAITRPKRKFRDIQYGGSIAVVHYCPHESSSASAEKKIEQEQEMIPKNSEEWLDIAAGFENKWHCLGAVDGKNVQIVPPKDSVHHLFSFLIEEEMNTFTYIFKEGGNFAERQLALEDGAEQNTEKKLCHFIEVGPVNKTSFWLNLREQSAGALSSSLGVSSNMILPLICCLAFCFCAATAATCALPLCCHLTTYLLCCSLPVPLSLADTWTMPLASMSNVTSIWGTPRGAGGMPTSVNCPNNLLSEAISLFTLMNLNFHLCLAICRSREHLQLCRSLSCIINDRPAFVWRESEKPLRKNHPQFTRPRLNINLPVLSSLAQHETSVLANYAEAGPDYSNETKAGEV